MRPIFFSLLCLLLFTPAFTHAATPAPIPGGAGLDVLGLFVKGDSRRQDHEKPA